MAEVLSRNDLYNIGRRYLIGRASRIDPRAVDTEGSDANIFVGSTAFMANAVMRQNIERINALLLDGCKGDDLDRYAFDRYQLPRKGAAAALGTVQLSRPSTTLGAGSIPVGTKLVSLSGIEYLTITTANFTGSGPNSLAVSANVRAAQAGKEFQVGSNQIRRVDKPNLLFDSSIVVNNSEPTAGGEAAEEDDVFKERIRDFWVAARRGTLAAIEFGARSVPGVESANALEVLDDLARPTRYVELYIADSSGVSSAALANLVDQTMVEYRPAGIYVGINTSRPQIVNVVFQPTFAAGVDTVNLAEQIRNAIVGYINSLRVNEPLLVSSLGALFARFKADGLIAYQTSLLEPLGDLIPSIGSTLRTRPENVQIRTPITAPGVVN